MAGRDPEQVVRAFYDAVEAGDHATVRDLLAAEVRWRQAASGVPAAGRILVGPDAVVDGLLVHFERDWDGFTEEVDHLAAQGTEVVVTGTDGGTYRGTGRALEAGFCHLCGPWSEGGPGFFRQFTDTLAFARAMT